jgi:outer membrane lipoprotein SlyB
MNRQMVQAGIDHHSIAREPRLGALLYVHATIVHPACSITQKVQSRRKPVKKTLMALAASTLLLPATAVVAADQFSVTTASAGYKEDVSYQNRNRQYREWRGKDGRTYCRRKNGTTGLIVGGAVGALAGRAIDTRGDRATGTIIGAAGGALLGREIDKGPRRCR